MLARSLAALTAVLAGLLGGGMLFIKLVLVPFWRGAPPAEFRDWFAAHSGRIRGLMVPLGASAGVVSAASLAAGVAQRSEGTAAAVTAAGATAGVIAITVLVNEPANERFTSGALTDRETSVLLDRWARWHDGRVLLGLIAAAAATHASRGR